MTGSFKAIKITENVYWVGAIDWGLRDFHGYATLRGTTYNAYLIMADKITLVDTVREGFADEMFSRIADVVDPEKIDYIISNHAEMDHTGSLPLAIDVIQPEKVFASTMGVKALSEHFNLDNITAVNDGEDLSLGNLNIKFIETKMLHWPDSMFTYLVEDKILFSQDAFGMHLASTERFASEINDGILEGEASKYYANILMPYSPLIKGLIAKVGKSGLKFNMVAPDHGPIWKEDFNKILGWYSKWSECKSTNKAVIIYDTMWKSTEKMARAIADGISEGGAVAKVMPLSKSHRSDVVTEVLDASALIVGSPTLNNNIMPTVSDIMTYLNGLKPPCKIGAVFGSYGWSGESVKQLEGIMNDMKIEMVFETLNSKYVPKEDMMKKCNDMGKAIASKLKESCN